MLPLVAAAARAAGPAVARAAGQAAVSATVQAAPSLLGFGTPRGHLAAPPPTVPPGRPTPAAPSAASIAPVVLGPPPSPVTAFDRPQAVVIVGPRPVPVTIEGGNPARPPGGSPASGPRPTWEARATRAVRTAGQVGVGLAHNSVGPAFVAAIGVATDGLERLGPTGRAAATGLRVATESFTAFRRTIDALTERGRELAQYSGPIAAANAQAQVRAIQADVREARATERGYANIAEGTSRIDTDVRDILLPIKTAIVDVVGDFVQTGANVVSIFKPILEGISEAIGLLTRTLGAPIKLLKEITGLLARLIGQNEDDRRDDDLLQQLLDAADKLGPGPPAPRDPAAGGSGPLGVPVVGGIL